MGDGIMALSARRSLTRTHACACLLRALRMQESVGRYADLVQKTEGILGQNPRRA